MSHKVWQQSWRRLSCMLCLRRQLSITSSAATSSLYKKNKADYTSRVQFDFQRPLASSMMLYHSSQFDSPDVSAIANDILAKTRTTDVMTDSLNPQDVETLVSTLLSSRFQTAQVESLLTGRVWLMRQSQSLLNLVSILCSHALAPIVLIDLVENVPHNRQDESGLEEIAHSIEFSIAVLRGMGYDDKGLRVFAAKSPAIFSMDKGNWEENWMKLQTLMSVQDARTVVTQTINVLSDPWEELQAKFDYVHFKMGCNLKQIVESNVFGYSLEHIENRHLFLSRAGLFAYVKLKDNPLLNPNPRLVAVLGKSIKLLMSKLNVPYLDDVQYSAFCQLREVERKIEEKERKEKEGLFDDDDDDDEEKNDDN